MKLGTATTLTLSQTACLHEKESRMSVEDTITALYRREQHLRRECDRIERERGVGEYVAYSRGQLSEIQFILDCLDPDEELGRMK